MCKNISLSHTQNGYAVYCRSCDSIELGFGTLIIRLKENEFNILFNEVWELAEKNKKHPNPLKKSVHIEIRKRQIYLVLSPIELQGLKVILKEAWSELQYYFLMR